MTDTATSAYAELLERCRPALAETPRPPLPDELELQALWFAGHFGRDFHSEDAGPLRVVQFGEWNRGAGPDFLHAVIEIDGQRHHGAIELDLDADSWEAHGHGANPAFDETVLHVFFHHPARPGFTRDSRHRRIPRLRVPEPLVDEALQRPASATAIARPGRCLQPLAEMPEPALASLLRQAAEHRAALKARRFLRVAAAHGRDTALLHATAATLGYRANTLPMELLVQRLPLPLLREAPEHAAARLFGAAGFLQPDLHERAPEDTRQHLRALWEQWWKDRARLESSHPIPWRLHGQRPANHPHRRIAALARLVAEWPRFRRLALARPFDPRPLRRLLESLEDPFWNHRHTLSSAASARPLALIGKSRAVELLANHLVPLALHEDPDFDFPDYLALAGNPPNEKLRRVAIRLFGSEATARPWLRAAAHQQALLQIYHDFCLEDLSDCHDCPFPEQLRQWQ